MRMTSPSMARVLKAHGQNARRGRAKVPKATRPPTTHIATAPGQVRSWDMTYLPTNVMGRWFHLHRLLDLYSRKIVGAEVHDSDAANRACRPAVGAPDERPVRRHALPSAFGAPPEPPR
jgi:transposase InsO family protein